jgi:iron(III) transport system ATP-binding protein
MTLLRVEGVSKRYGAVAALDGIDLDVAAGSRTAIVGPSGSGKTTLLRLIAGFEVPDTGRIVLGDAVMVDGQTSVPAHLRGIGFVPQDGALFPHLSIAENIGFGLDRRMPGRKERILALMDSVELAHSMRDRRPHELTGVQQQRVALARALARQPKLMLFDEPFSALDPDLRETIRNVVAEVLHDAGITALLVTHDQTEALTFADWVAIFDGGRLRQVGTPRQIYLNPRDAGAASFLGDAIILPAVLGGGWADCALGRVATDAASEAAGSGEIVLRPEQLRLTAAGAGDEPGAHYGQVTRVEFGGTVCKIHVALEATPRLLMVKSAGIELPQIGERMRIAVLGRVHVLGERLPTAE